MPIYAAYSGAATFLPQNEEDAFFLTDDAGHEWVCRMVGASNRKVEDFWHLATEVEAHWPAMLKVAPANAGWSLRVLHAADVEDLCRQLSGTLPVTFGSEAE